MELYNVAAFLADLTWQQVLEGALWLIGGAVVGFIVIMGIVMISAECAMHSMRIQRHQREADALMANIRGRRFSDGAPAPPPNPPKPSSGVYGAYERSIGQYKSSASRSRKYYEGMHQMHMLNSSE